VAAGSVGTFSPARKAAASSNPISFEVPSIMDPIHTFGEPDIGVDAASHVFVSGPTGTGTQRSMWEGSSDGGHTYRVISPGPPPSALQGTNAPPGGGDTDIAFDNHTPQKQYFADLYALFCNRQAVTSDEGATASQSVYPAGCTSSFTTADRPWMAVYDPPAGTPNRSAYLGAKPLIYEEFNGNGGDWTKSNDGLNFTSANQGTDGGATGSGSFGPDGYPAIDQVTGKVFQAAGPNNGGNDLYLNVGTPDSTGYLHFLDDSNPGSTSNLIHIAHTVGSPDILFSVLSIDSARNLHVVWGCGCTSTPTQMQIWVSVAPADNPTPVNGCSTDCWNNWAAPVQVSDGSTATGDAVNVFPWIKAGGPGRADAVWYGDRSTLDPSSTASGHVWNAWMNQVVWPVDSNGEVTGAAPTTQLVKVSPHPMDYQDVCLSGTGCVTNSPPGNRNLADFFEVNIDHSGAAEVVYDDISNGLIQQPFASSNPADHAGAGVVTVARQNGGPGLFGTDVTGPSAAPTTGQTDAAGDALYNVIGGTNRTSLDFTSNQLSLSGGTLTVTMKVADLSAATFATDSSNIAGDTYQQYVTRWQMGNTIYFAMMETTAAQRLAGTDAFFAGAAQSIDLCSVSACFPHVIYYPESGTTGHVESGTVSCPSSPSASTPCTITITVNAADVGSPSSSSLLEEVGSYAFASSHLQAAIDNAQAAADNVPLEIDGICCFNFQGTPTNPIPETPWAPALLGAGVLIAAGGLTARRRRATGRVPSA
jgi:hypothetical protein